MRWSATQIVTLALHGAALLLAEGTGVCLMPPRISLGRFPANRPPAAELVLVNGGNAQLTGVRVRTGCGCLSAMPEGDAVQPGGQLRIRLSVAPEKVAGPFSHGVFVEAGESLLRASVTGEAIPLLTVRPQDAANLGDVACGSPFRAEFLLNAAEPASLGRISASPLEAEVLGLSPASFRVVLRGSVPAEPGRFRLSASVPVVSPPGWRPMVLTVFGNAKAASGKAHPMDFQKNRATVISHTGEQP